jgi:hypothetical protein
VSIGNFADHLLNGRSYPARQASREQSRAEFRRWSARRPFVGGALIVLAGIEMFFSGQLDIGHIHVQVGIEGFQATVIPVALVLLGLLAILMPAHRIFYGIIALVIAVYSLIGVNLGGFIVGMLLGTVGGILVVSWMPKKKKVAAEPRPLDPRR